MRFSVITPVLNAASTIERTVKSVLGQRGDFTLEYIIIDGGSTDGTLARLAPFADRAKLVSEPDGGLYFAMNKGIELASGEVVGIVNADDYYFPNALSMVADALRGRKLDNLILWGDVEYQRLGRVKGWRPRNRYVGAFAPHPSMFVPLQLYRRIGAYNTRYRYLADYDFMYRALNVHGVEPLYLEEPLAFFSAGGLAETHVRECLAEELEIKLANGANPAAAKLLYLLKLIKNYRKFLK